MSYTDINGDILINTKYLLKHNTLLLCSEHLKLINFIQFSGIQQIEIIYICSMNYVLIWCKIHIFAILVNNIKTGIP